MLAVLAEGLSNDLISERLGMSPHTTRTHVSCIFAELGVASRLEAGAVARRLRLER